VATKKERSVTQPQKLSAFILCGKQKKAKRKISISGKNLSTSAP